MGRITFDSFSIDWSLRNRSIDKVIGSDELSITTSGPAGYFIEVKAAFRFDSVDEWKPFGESYTEYAGRPPLQRVAGSAGVSGSLFVYYPISWLNRPIDLRINILTRTPAGAERSREFIFCKATSFGTAPVEQTVQFWLNKGYTQIEAEKLAEWVNVNMTSPSQEKIQEIVRPVVTTEKITLSQEDALYWVDLGYAPGHAAAIAAWYAINKMSPSAEQIERLKPAAAAAYAYRILPEPDPIFKGYGLDLYKQLDNALFNKSILETRRILSEGVNVEMSPIVFLAAVLLVAKVVAVIVSVLGSIGFAEFLTEEAIQSTDQAIYSASKDKNWELEGKALAKKKELLERDAWERIITLIPGVNVIAAAWKYFEAAQTKYDIDLKLWKDKATATGVNTDVNLEKAAEAIEKGEDPTQYLPTATSETIPELISGDVTGVIDGDTIDVKDMTGIIYRIRLIGIDAPENKTKEGKAATEYLTNLIINRRVAVMVDPNNKVDQYKRVLGVVFLAGKDINKEMLSSGNAIYYQIGGSKYYSDAEYQSAVKKLGKVKISSKPTYCKVYVNGTDTGTLTPETLSLTEGTYTLGAAKEGYIAKSQIVDVIKNVTTEIHFELKATGLGGEAEEEPGAPAEEKPEFKIYFTSKPSNAKIYIDGVYTKHRTPSDQKELKDVLNYLTAGKHTIKVEKAGAQAEEEIIVTEGDNGTHHFDLEAAGLPVVTAEEGAVATIDVKARITEIEKLLNELKSFIGL